MVICEGLYFIAGLYALIAGKIRVYRKKVIKGKRAQLLGVILILPAPIAFGLGWITGITFGMTPEIIGLLTIFEAVMLIGVLIAVIVIGVTTPDDPDDDLWPPIAPDISETGQKLQQLHEMLDAGLITREEYEDKRTDIITKM